MEFDLLVHVQTDHALYNYSSVRRLSNVHVRTPCTRTRDLRSNEFWTSSRSDDCMYSTGFVHAQRIACRASKPSMATYSLRHY